VSLRLGGGHPVDRAFRRTSEVERHAVDSRQHDERLRPEMRGKQCTRQILVDDRRRAAVASVHIANDRDAASAGRDRNRAGIQ